MTDSDKKFQSLAQFPMDHLSNPVVTTPIVLLYSYLPTPPLGKDMTQCQFLSEV